VTSLNPNPLVFHNAVNAGAAIVAVWTPPAYRRAQLLKLIISVNGTLAAGASTIINILDGSTNIGLAIALVPGVALNTSQVLEIDLPGDGYVQTVDNTALNVYVSATLISGNIVCTMVGYEV
jgi:hypothetical protein